MAEHRLALNGNAHTCVNAQRIDGACSTFATLMPLLGGLDFLFLVYYHHACRVLTPIITQQEQVKGWSKSPICTPKAKRKIKMSINLKNKQEVVKEFGKNEKDTGSSAVQVAMMTKKISELTEHLKANKKDFATKRGLLMMVGKRKRLLAYIKSQNLDEYRELIKKLGIRG